MPFDEFLPGSFPGSMQYSRVRCPCCGYVFQSSDTGPSIDHSDLQTTALLPDTDCTADLSSRLGLSATSPNLYSTVAFRDNSNIGQWYETRGDGPSTFERPVSETALDDPSGGESGLWTIPSQATWPECSTTFAILTVHLT